MSRLRDPLTSRVLPFSRLVSLGGSRGRFASSVRIALATFFLAPLLVFGLVVSGPVAQAAVAVTKHSGTTGIEFSPDNWRSRIPGHYINCTATLFYSIYGDAAAGAQTLGMKGGNCDTGPGFNISGWPVTVDVKGLRQDGTVCTSQGVTSVNEDDNETLPTLYIALGDVTVATACAVTEVCFTFLDAAFIDTEWKDCTLVDMGPPAFPTEQGGQQAQTCSEGGLKSVSSAAAYLTDPDHAYIDVSLTWSDNTPVGSTWRVVWVLTPPGTMAPYTGNHIRANIVVPANRTTTKTIQVASYPVPASPSNWTQFVGAMTYPAYAPYGGSSGYTTEFNELYLPAQGLLGTSDVSKCRFYFGPKIAEVPDSTIDEPMGSVNAAPPPPPTDDVEPEPVNPPPASETESSCDFSVTDPGTWLEGGMCAAVGLLGAIAGLIADLVQLMLELIAAVLGLMDDLLQLLEDAFVPDPASWDFNGLLDQAKARPPFSIVEAGMTTTAAAFEGYRDAGDCAALPNFDIVEGNQDVMGCNEFRNSPGVSGMFAIVQAGLLITTLIYCVKLLTNAVNPA